MTDIERLLEAIKSELERQKKDAVEASEELYKRGYYELAARSAGKEELCKAFLSAIDVLQSNDKWSNELMKARVKKTGESVVGFTDGEGHFDVFVDHDIFHRFFIWDVEIEPSKKGVKFDLDKLREVAKPTREDDKAKKEQRQIERVQRSWYLEGYHDRDNGMEPMWLIENLKYKVNPNYGKPLPICEELDCEIQKYISDRWKMGGINPTTPIYLYDFTLDELKECANHFANWQKRKDSLHIQEICKENGNSFTSDELEGAAIAYATETVGLNPDGSEEAEVIKEEMWAFIAGAKWHKGHIAKVVEQYVEKGDRCMDESENDQGAYTFWDGFHNCAENIQRELKDFNP